jgi:ubiquinone/menaquinone biosynthesis C-methylase UbiE
MNKFISLLLSSPVFFNSIRNILAGDQTNTKNFVSKYLKENKVKTILDVGCGTGDFAPCTPKNASYTGVDISEQYLDFAQKKYGSKNKVFLNQDVTDINFYSKKKYDGVLFVSMLHHLSDKELEKMLPVIKKITKGVIIIADIIPNPPGMLRKFLVKLDQGKYVRRQEAKLKILKKYFKVVHTEIIPSRLAVQFGVVCKV